MRNNIKISDVRYTPAGPQEVSKGFRGWIACILNGRIQIDGITLRRTRGGRMTLSFPSNHDKTGNQHFYIRPLDDAARRVVERQIFQALGLRERTTR